MIIPFTLNGNPEEIDFPPLALLAEVLRDRFNLVSVSRGCEGGGCGKCMVLINNQPVLSCLVPMFQVKNTEILTCEGFRKTEDYGDIEAGFKEAGFRPCAEHFSMYMFLCHALLERIAHPSKQDITATFTGFHPVCGGYSALQEGVHKAAARRFLRHNEQNR